MARGEGARVVTAAIVENPGASPAVHEALRRAVRGVLEDTPSWRDAAPAFRKALANKMVRAAMMAADVVGDEHALTESIRARAPVASAQAFTPGAVNSAAGAFKATRDAIDFPNYVTSLINGVFQAITGSTMHQLERFAELLDHVAASADSFASTNVSDADVLRWAAGKFSFLKLEEGTLSLRDGVDLSQKRAQLKESLDATEGEVATVDDGDLEGTLLPLCRRKMGKDKQSMLGTMVQLGLQRVVVDEGRLHASMDMRVDARSIEEQASQDRTEVGVSADVSASGGVGLWSASARVSTNFSKVHAEQDVKKDDVAVRAGLRSSVDLAFRTEQIPLDRMASKSQRVKLDANARVPVGVDDKSLLSEAPARLTTPDAMQPRAPASVQAPPPPTGNAPGGGNRPAATTPAPAATTPTPAATTPAPAVTTPAANAAPPR